ncbi:MAG TPA: sialate O-acetylesterase [Cyclobacteriaceae bacterium]|nr:sialate O-acetylesterase [Cyclobacteriaceae bacterium]
MKTIPMNKKIFCVASICLCLLITADLAAQIKLPRLISDGVIFQRDAKLKVWGWASAKEDVSLLFKDKVYKTSADENGRWELSIPSQPSGGPFEMTFKGKNEITIHNILFGDVWVCSGQSNMELTMDRAKDRYPSVIANSENTNIRQFLVPDKYDFKKAQDDLDGGTWESANPKNLLQFSAVAYFFAKEIYEKEHVPIGLINAALGGSPVEAWMSEDALIPFPSLHDELIKFRDDKVIQEIESSDNQRSKDWYKELNSKDIGLSSSTKWTDPKLDDNDWTETTVPGFWADGQLKNTNGAVWYRRKINVPKSLVGMPLRLWLGRIVDQDSVFVNGKFVGTTGYQYPPRKYVIGPSILNEGENTIVVRIINSGGKGGFVPNKPYFIASEKDTVNLTGTWKYKLGTAMPPLAGSTAVRWKPGGLYNKMISPLLTTSIKGVIWYQGESNASRADEYRKTFPALIKNWREKWKQVDFPFLFVQLANFMEKRTDPSESEWASLRDAQLHALTLPKTGMAVAIDLGEWNDIHPLNKKDVGHRLAVIAEHLAYNDKKNVYSGPLYQSSKINGNKIEISFTNVGSGLLAKSGDLNYFSIAGADKKFVWAKAKIENNKIVVWSDEVVKPELVRYAWADNPEGANLYNKEGLPASPFSFELKK